MSTNALPKPEIIFPQPVNRLPAIMEKLKTHAPLVRQEIEYLMTRLNTDPTTGLSNRAKLDEDINYAIEHVKRYQNALTMLFIDVDGMKEMNTDYGHLGTDEWLGAMGKFLNEMRSVDRKGRYGGDEILYLIEETLHDAVNVAERIREGVSNLRVPFNGGIVQSTVSIGIARYEEGMDSKAFIEAANKGAFYAKHAGKNSIKCGN